MEHTPVECPVKRSRSDRASQTATRHTLDREQFDALYDFWFPRAIGWSCRRGCTGQDAERVVAVALEALFRELACGVPQDDRRVAQQLLIHLSRAHDLLAERSARKRGGARVSPRRFPIAAHSSR
jgi:hypothetical protein